MDISHSQKNKTITTGLGVFSKEKFNALLNVRGFAMAAFREVLHREGHVEVTTSSLVNIAGSCENPYASFNLNYYGREAHLSQSAQLQLEALVMRLRRGVFTVNNSFREENYDDPEAAGRRLSEFTLIEPERPYENHSGEEVLDNIMMTEERIMKFVIRRLLDVAAKDIEILGGDIAYLANVLAQPFQHLTYSEALRILNGVEGPYVFGDDLGIREERRLLAHFNGIPTFVTHFPAKLKFFNVKRTPDGDGSYTADLLMPKLGETVGGAVREEDGEKIAGYLLDSKVAQYIREHGGDPLEPFAEYFKIFREEPPVTRGGFGIGFERFIGFLIGSNDILNTIAYRAMHP